MFPVVARYKSSVLASLYSDEIKNRKFFHHPSFFRFRHKKDNIFSRCKMFKLPSVENLFGIFISIGKEHFAFHGLVNSAVKWVEFDVVGEKKAFLRFIISSWFLFCNIKLSTQILTSGFQLITPIGKLWVDVLINTAGGDRKDGFNP